jgi:hypothetical protein
MDWWKSLIMLQDIICVQIGTHIMNGENEVPPRRVQPTECLGRIGDEWKNRRLNEWNGVINERTKKFKKKEVSNEWMKEYING